MSRIDPRMVAVDDTGMTNISGGTLQEAMESVDGQLGGIGSGVQPYTPVWTGTTGNSSGIGDGALVGRYQTMDKMLWVTIGLQIGSTTSISSGTWMFSLPPGIQVEDILGLGGFQAVGPAVARDVSPNAVYNCVARATHTGGSNPNKIQVFRGDGANDALTNSSPFIWSTGDTLLITMQIVIL